MYTPPSFQQTDRQQIKSLIDVHGFGLLITQVEQDTRATHLPWLFHDSPGEQGTLLGHIAKANPQWQSGDCPALAIFTGPHAYISPTYYQAEDTVPTWNYAAVHVHGRVSFFHDRASLRAAVGALVEKYESRRAPSWQWDANTPYAEKMLAGIVGVRLTIERIEATWKLNQNHPTERRQRVIDALELEGGEQPQGIAALMRASVASK